MLAGRLFRKESRLCGCGVTSSTASGMAVGLAGLGLVGVGVWAHREVARTLARERVVSTSEAKPPNAPVTSGAAARSLAEVIRRSTVAATGGRTYAEVEEYLDADGNPTSDSSLALKDEAGRPVRNPQHALWLQSMTLQTALMQAYMASRLAVLTVAVGAGFIAVGAGLAAAGASR